MGTFVNLVLARLTAVAFWRKDDAVRRAAVGVLGGPVSCAAAGRSGGLPCGLAAGRVAACGCVGAAG
jgi:hypothetical protein